MQCNLKNNFAYRSPYIRLMLETMPIIVLVLFYVCSNIFIIQYQDRVLRQQFSEQPGQVFNEEVLVKYFQLRKSLEDGSSAEIILKDKEIFLEAVHIV